jgi:phosphatidylserine/phosphatidylglycerophosphate/cardiolipin synthase-like enzyme
MHAKVCVCDDTTFVGSCNLSRSGEKNAENVLEIEDARIADRLAAFVDEVRARYPRVTIAASGSGPPPGVSSP